MLYSRNSYSTQSFVNKTKYAFVFNNCRDSDFWFKQFVSRFERELVSVDYGRRVATFIDSIYYFVSTSNVKSYLKIIRPDFEWGIEELYIILDDPGRMYLETYLDDEPEI